MMLCIRIIHVTINMLKQKIPLIIPHMNLRNTLGHILGTLLRVLIPHMLGINIPIT